LAVVAVSALQRAGLDRLVYAEALRRLGKRFLLREERVEGERVIASGPGRGLWLSLLPDTPNSYWMGTHEPDMQAALLKHVKPGMTVYDCGANVGYYALIFAKLIGPRGRVYAFEPSPASLKCLRAGRELNGFENLTVVPQAAWDKKEMLRFVRGAPDSSLVTDHVEGVFGESAETNNIRESLIEVPATSLDHFVYEEGHAPPDFIKMDIEGAEGKAIAGARRVIAEHRPVLLLEIHGAPGREVWSILKELNYTAVNISTGEVPRTAEEFAIYVRQYLALAV